MTKKVDEGFWYRVSKEAIEKFNEKTMPKKKTKKKSPPRPRAAAHVAKPVRKRAASKSAGTRLGRQQEPDEVEETGEELEEDLDANAWALSDPDSSPLQRLDDLEEIVIPLNDRLTAIEKGQIVLGKRLKKIEAALELDDESNSLMTRVEELEKISEALLEADVGEDLSEGDNEHA